MRGIKLSKQQIAFFLKKIKVIESENRLDFLNSIITGIFQYIPFQNFTLINANKIRPNTEIIIRDMMDCVGGLCNVRNGFLYILLNNIGFKVEFLSASMEKEDCHVILLVEIDKEKYIVDTGNGFPYLSAINITNHSIFSHPYIKYRIIKKEDRFWMQHMMNGIPVDNFNFNLKPVSFSSFNQMLDKQYSEENWGPFLKSIRINIWTKGGGFIIRDKLSLKVNNGERYKHKIKEMDECEKIITEELYHKDFIDKVSIKKSWAALK